MNQLGISDLMLRAFLECLILVGIHAYLGLHVIRRQVIFVDLALAQVAALGTTVEVPLIEGSRQLDIRRGTQPGDVIVLRGEGVARLRGYGRGDLQVHVRVTIPRKLNAEQESLLRQYAEVSGSQVAGKKKGLFGRKR